MQSISGITATIFGATGFMGPYVGAILGYIGSNLIFPHSHLYGFDDHVKELKLCAATGYSRLVHHFDFKQESIDEVIKDSNVVINLLGPRYGEKRTERFELINIEYAKRIALACAKNQKVLRLIHFSACGVDKDSPSQDLKTKFLGEQEVLNIFPNATIFRPTTVYGYNDYFTKLILDQRRWLYHFNFVTDNCQAKRQPILINDLAQCVLNALKLPESCGQIYEIGGPHVFTRLELYEILYNIIGRPPKIVYVNHDLATTVAKNFVNWDHFSYERMLKDKLDLIVSGQTKTIDDLCVKPVSFTYAIEPLISQFKARYPLSHDEHER